MRITLFWDLSNYIVSHSKDSNLHSHCFENLKSHKMITSITYGTGSKLTTLKGTVDFSKATTVSLCHMSIDNNSVMTMSTERQKYAMTHHIY
jgi:hypothetical protein